MDALPSLEALHSERQHLLCLCVNRQAKPRRGVRQLTETFLTQNAILAAWSLLGLVSYLALGWLRLGLPHLIRELAFATFATGLGLLVLFSLVARWEPAWSRRQRQVADEYQTTAQRLAALYGCGPAHHGALHQHVAEARATVHRLEREPIRD